MAEPKLVIYHDAVEPGLIVKSYIGGEEICKRTISDLDILKCQNHRDLSELICNVAMEVAEKSGMKWQEVANAMASDVLESWRPKPTLRERVNEILDEEYKPKGFMDNFFHQLGKAMERKAEVDGITIPKAIVVKEKP